MYFIAAVPAIWALYQQRKFISIYPDPRLDCKLLQKGPYHLIRHPMYSSLFFIVLIISILNFSFIAIIKFVLFIVVIFIKLNVEERLLKKRFQEYEKYKCVTKRIIPFIY